MSNDAIIGLSGMVVSLIIYAGVWKHSRDVFRAMRFRVRLEILITRRNGYQSENAMRDRVGQALAYGEEAFFGIERELKSLVSTFERGKELA